MTITADALLSRHVLEVQSARRLPSLAMGVAAAGSPMACQFTGLADVAGGVAAEAVTQYRIGSVTKTFTAAVVLLLAQRGVLNLDDKVEAYLPGTTIGRPTLRQLLCHSGGIQREAPLAMWSTMQGPDQNELLRSLSRAEMVDQPGVRWHYSNLGYAVLGQIVERITGQTCADLIDSTLVKPLGLNATTWQPTTNAASGYRLDPYQDLVHPEPLMQQGTIGVGGQLWSTIPDLLTWGHALAGGAPDVLPESVIDLMHTPEIMLDTQWTRAWGLGLILDRRPSRVMSGHTGAMPGFLAALSLDRSSRTVVAAMANVTRGVDLGALVGEVLEEIVSDVIDVNDVAAVNAAAPRPSDPRPTQPCPAGMTAMLGRWWCEAEETVFTWQDGTLKAHLSDDPALSQTVFTREGDDRYRAASGRMKGELLIVARDADGQIVALEWATYPYTRSPR